MKGICQTHSPWPVLIASAVLLSGCRPTEHAAPKASQPAAVRPQPVSGPGVPSDIPSVVICEDGIRRNVHSTRAWYLCGVANYKVGRYNSASTDLLRCLSLPTKDAAVFRPAALYYLGWTYVEAGETARSVAVFQRITRLDSTPTQKGMAFYSLGDIFWRMKRYGESGHAYQNCLRYTPRDELAYYELGRVAVRQNRFEDARACLLRASALAPSSQRKSHDLAMLGAMDQVHFKNMLAARSEYAAALKLDPHNQTALEGTDEVDRSIEAAAGNVKP
jgi:tetratricopeptide (TPR) repeat protein